MSYRPPDGPETILSGVPRDLKTKEKLRWSSLWVSKLVKSLVERANIDIIENVHHDNM